MGGEQAQCTFQMCWGRNRGFEFAEETAIPVRGLCVPPDVIETALNAERAISEQALADGRTTELHT